MAWFADEYLWSDSINPRRGWQGPKSCVFPTKYCSGSTWWLVYLLVGEGYNKCQTALTLTASSRLLPTSHEHLQVSSLAERTGELCLTWIDRQAGRNSVKNTLKNTAGMVKYKWSRTHNWKKIKHLLVTGQFPTWCVITVASCLLVLLKLLSLLHTPNSWNSHPVGNISGPNVSQRGRMQWIFMDVVSSYLKTLVLQIEEEGNDILLDHLQRG